MKMAVAAVDGAQGLAIEERDVPDPGPGEVLLKVVSAGICGSDLHMLPVARPGTVLGHEYAGTVVATGAGVSTLTEGDLVCSLPAIGCGVCLACQLGDPVHCPSSRHVGSPKVAGAFAQYVIAGERESLKQPANIDPALGSLVEPLAVGLNIFESAQVGIGDRVVIFGAGPVGLAVTLWAATMGVAHIVVSDPLPVRRALAEQVGATAVVDPLNEDLAAVTREAIGGRPEVVIECAGRPGTVDDATALVAHRGRVVIAGIHLQPHEQFSRMQPYRKSATVQFSSWYTLKHFRHTLRMWETNRLDPTALVTHQATLADLPRIVQELQRPNDFGKVVINPDAG